MKKLDVFFLLLFGIALILRLRWILMTGFNGLYGQDAYAYYDFALELRQALIEWRLPGAFFWPLGYPSLLMLAFAGLGMHAWVGQALSVVMGSLIASFVYVLARQMDCGRPGAIAAGLLMAVCGQSMQSSIVLMADIPALFWVTLSSVLLVLYVQNATENRYSLVLIASALLLTFAGVTRWLCFTLAPIWTLVVVLYWHGKIRWRDSIIVITTVLLIVLPQLAYSRTTPYPTFNHTYITLWSPFNALKQNFINADGSLSYEFSNARLYAAPLLNPYYLAPVFIPFVAIGLLYLWRNAAQRLATVLLVGWMLIPYLYLIGIPSQNIRFPLIIFPPIAIFAAFGIHALWESRFKFIRILLVLIIILGVGHTLKTSEATIGNFIGNQQQDKAIVAWAAEQIPADATVYTFGLTLTLRHETTFIIYDLYFETPQSLDEKWTRGQYDYLLVNGWVINHQWEGREPYIALQWLFNQRGLIQLGRYGNYTLYQIRA